MVCGGRGKIFWATAAEGGERVETARGDGSGRRVLLDAASEPRLAGVASDYRSLSHSHTHSRTHISNVD